MEDIKKESIKDIQEKLNRILRNCDTCKAKICGICPNSKMKKSLKLKLKNLGYCSGSNENKIIEIVKRIKKFFK